MFHCEQNAVVGVGHNFVILFHVYIKNVHGTYYPAFSQNYFYVQFIWEVDPPKCFESNPFPISPSLLAVFQIWINLFRSKYRVYGCRWLYIFLLIYKNYNFNMMFNKIITFVNIIKHTIVNMSKYSIWEEQVLG